MRWFKKRSWHSRKCWKSLAQENCEKAPASTGTARARCEHVNPEDLGYFPFNKKRERMKNYELENGISEVSDVK